MGYAIKSNLIQKVFSHEDKQIAKEVSFDKIAIYEKMLPSVVFVGVQLNKWKQYL